MPFLSQPGLLDISLPEMSGTAVVSSDGTFFKCRFDPVNGGECTREDWQKFLLPEDDE